MGNRQMSRTNLSYVHVQTHRRTRAIAADLVFLVGLSRCVDWDISIPS